ncbi:MAG: DNA polymerase III subunit alpha [Cyclobacteriaceae bacterium]|nr:DNA polymerase III subunit alpha [Cyclobacteriaceae bacterium]
MISFAGLLAEQQAVPTQSLNALYWNCHTYFSFGYGTLSVEDLFDEAKKNGVHKLILTDQNNTSGYIELLRLCRERRGEWELEIALGIEFRSEQQLLYIGLARNNEGFEELNRYLSHHNKSGQSLRKTAPPFGHAYVVYPLANQPARLRENEFVGIRMHEQTALFAPLQKARAHQLVAWHPVTFRHKQGFNIHRLLRAIDLNILLSKLPVSQQADPSEIMMPEHELKNKYSAYPELIHNAERLVADCSIRFELGVDKNRKFFTGSKYEDREYLFARAREGYEQRYAGRQTLETEERFERELDIIAKKNFEAYFLFAYDIIRFADSRGFAHVGRGSGANSVIAYCLGITGVDPIGLDLYFERFLNTERSSPPDFDIDFSWRDRDEVIRYIFRRFGEDHVALLGTHTTYQRRSVLRELGKVFGLPREEIDKIVAQPDNQASHLQDDITRLIFRYAGLMKDIPRHLSIHAGGILITERPMYTYTALDLPPKGFPVAHFEMHNAEDMGIYKLDILSQRGLGHIRDTATIVYENQGIRVDTECFHEFKEDPAIRELLRTGNCMGCFYVESPATRMLLGKLGCEDYLTLVAASSIIRPGVASSGMMRTYIERHHAVRQGRSYQSVHPRLDEIMKETYGVMVYQEDVIKVAHHFAGLTLTQADVLRRGMSGKYRSRREFQQVKDQFFENCHRMGYSVAVTERVWFEIESFAGYSFAKGHSASYAVESYQSLYLKAHYPLEFMVGVINNFGGFYKTEFYIHEARKWGAQIEAPCVNHGRYLTSIRGNVIYIGFVHLRDLSQKAGEQIVAERERNGPYRSLDHFIRRVPMGQEDLQLLVRSGAFRFTGQKKKELLWQVQLYIGQKARKQVIGGDLFDEEPERYSLPTLTYFPLEDAYDEIELLDFPLCDPFLLVDAPDTEACSASQLRDRLLVSVTITGYLVTTKQTRAKTGEQMYFGTFYDWQGAVFDTVHFPQQARQYPFRGRGFYRLSGRVVEDFGYPMIEVSKMEKLPMKEKTWLPGCRTA